MGPLVTRQGHLIRQSGTIGMDLWSMDWKFAKGHRIAVRVTDANPDWWVHTSAGQSVDLTGGSFTLPWLRYTRPGRIAGNPGVQLPEYLKETITVPQSLIASSDVGELRDPAAADQQPALRHPRGLRPPQVRALEERQVVPRAVPRERRRPARAARSPRAGSRAGARS